MTTSSHQIALLVGFDRCGSSMISKLLAKHPQVNLIFQPFNSTEITKRQWEVWRSDDALDTPSYRFFQQLTEGVIDESYIQSNWFYNHSTSLTLKPTHLNLIKDTKLHFKAGWLRKNFPSIRLIGIWRDPRAILCSLVRNDFHHTWYDSLNKEELGSIIKKTPLLSNFAELLPEITDHVDVMALALAIRTYYLQAHLSDDEWLVYEDILRSPAYVLNKFLQQFGREEFPFDQYVHQDYNIAGKPFESNELWQTYFSGEKQHMLNRIFAPLLQWQQQHIYS